MEKLGLYLSIPFCRSKCTYCNFSSGVFPVIYHERYVSRIEEDLAQIRDIAKNWGAALPDVVDSIYLGGGTPSLLSSALLLRLFGSLRRGFAVMPTAEITMECAPGQIEPAVLEAMMECGVNRISLGVQSFVDTEARATGRLHTRDIALEDIRRIQDAGFAEVSADLIAGLPGQTPESWFESLRVLADSGVNHASIYMLEVDDDSRLGREMRVSGDRYRAQTVPSDDLIAEMYAQAIDFLAVHGLAQYEISNFARPGSESQHNLRYWRRQPYAGFGLDAYSMLRGRTGGAFRFGTVDALEQYLTGPAWEEARRLTREEEMEEAWFLGLRMNEGVSLAALRAEFSALETHDWLATIAALEEDHLVHFEEGDRVRLTERGRMLSNEVFTRFLREPALA